MSQGKTENGTQIVFKNRSEVDNFLSGIYQQMRDRQEHWYLDLLLIGDSHADNAYAGTTGAEVVPFENNSIEGSNSVVDRDWARYLEDIARANRLIINVDSVADKSISDADIKVYKAQGKIFRALAMFDMVRIFGSIPVITTQGKDITAENIEAVYPEYFPSKQLKRKRINRLRRIFWKP
ncbi:RagB/SusD family nutrient uptake outer membrane protein [Sphingobacterium sp. E70]|uniref:RagB/SusD family nutrient uptake outer membrane protein n=1 Tax=Sphingobacterium sp. E70 TaxID=2853439 RepID=UPI00211BD1E5|nr:RagB/SusD family nutrient uptake outer membrane protein [Sphingobacterium sp. E70]ULT27987.1 RagB/SusD family nutrient uptake outer membrane protein [Sphingobacterium sp. E70]